MVVADDCSSAVCQVGLRIHGRWCSIWKLISSFCNLTNNELFDAMIDPPGSTERSIAQATLSTMFPETTTAATLLIPNTIEAYVTRDYQQLIPGDPIALFQAAFMVIQRNVQVFDELVAIIKKGNFLPATGWDGMGWAGLRKKGGSHGHAGLDCLLL
jgi:hypothetical protein